MGYYTNYYIEVTEFSNENDFFHFKESLGLLKELPWFFDRSTLVAEMTRDHMNWYQWEKDLVALSKRWPNLLFEVEGVGEDPDDHWRARLRGGEIEIVRASKVFPDFVRIRPVDS